MKTTTVMDVNWLWGLLGAASAVAGEWLMRRYPGHSWFWYLRFTFGPQLLVSYVIYRIMRDSESMLAGVMMFNISSAAIRFGTQLFLLNETVPAGQWVAFALIVAAAFVRALWR